jgi:hypothetical protein
MIRKESMVWMMFSLVLLRLIGDSLVLNTLLTVNSAYILFLKRSCISFLMRWKIK